MRPILLLFPILLPLVAWGRLQPDQFHYSRPLEGALPPRAAAVSAEFDASLYRSAAEGYADVRIMDSQGAEIPCAIEKVVMTGTRTVRRDVAAHPVSMRELSGNRIEAEFVLERADDHADGFDVATPRHDFVREVSVEGSREGSQWEMLVPRAEIFDYHRYLDVRKTEVVFPRGAGGRFRIVIGKASEERLQPLVKLVSQKGGRDSGTEIRTEELLTTPFRMDGIHFWRNETLVESQREERRDWDLPAATVSENEQDHATEIILDTARLPLNRLVVSCQSHNFSRPVRLQVPCVAGGVAGWCDLAQGRLVDIDLPGYTRSDRDLDFPEQRVSKLRLVVMNGDSPPLAGWTIKGSGPVYRLLFLADPGRSYRLLYGAAAAAPPVYDLDAVLSPVRSGLRPGLLALGPQETNPRYRADRAASGQWYNRPAVLTGAIIAAVLVLLGVLARSLKQVGHLDDAG